jgi:glycosyltransferase involved in cell wall biosynthesis
MRIGVPTTSYPRFAGDPAGAFVRALCIALVARGHACEVLAPDDAEARALDDDGVLVTRVPYLPPGWPTTFYGAGAPDNLAADPRTVVGALTFPPRLAAEIALRGRRWDAVLSHWALPSALATWAARGAAAHVAVWHSADVHLARRLAGSRAWDLVRRTAARHVLVAEHLRERLCRGAHAGPEGTAIVPMGVDWPATAPTRAPLPGRPLRALVLARLVPIKRVELAIDAVERSAGVELVVAGDGPMRRALEERAGALGARARFVGTVGPTERDELLGWCDLLLATSGEREDGGTEGCPVAPREALAHGAMVLATDDVVHRELAERARGAVVLARVEELPGALARLARDPTAVLAARARARRAAADDAWPRVAATIEALIEDARADQSSTRRAPGWGAASSWRGSRVSG